MCFSWSPYLYHAVPQPPTHWCFSSWDAVFLSSLQSSRNLVWDSDNNLFRWESIMFWSARSSSFNCFTSAFNSALVRHLEAPWERRKEKGLWQGQIQLLLQNFFFFWCRQLLRLQNSGVFFSRGEQPSLNSVVEVVQILGGLEWYYPPSCNESVGICWIRPLRILIWEGVDIYCELISSIFANKREGGVEWNDQQWQVVLPSWLVSCVHSM